MNIYVYRFYIQLFLYFLEYVLENELEYSLLVPCYKMSYNILIFSFNYKLISYK